MKLQIFLGTFLALLLSAPSGTNAAPQSGAPAKMTNSAPATCPVTHAGSARSFGKRTPGSDAMSLFEAGTSRWKPALFVGLWPDGTVVFTAGGPGFILPDGSLSMKFWWTRGEGLHGKLVINGERLDAPAPPLRASIPEGYGDTGFQATALIFRTEGCREVTGQVADTRVTFVTRVVKLAAPK